MPAQGGALQVNFTSADLHKMYTDLKAAPGAMQVELRKGMKVAADPMVKRVKSSSSFSSRIPGAVSAKVSFSAKSAAVSVQVNSGKAPEARPLENGGKGGTFRHPVYGNTDNWVDQKAQPFFFGNATKDAEMTKAMNDVMDAFAKRLGFK
jgi:hypothetical protein